MTNQRMQEVLSSLPVEEAKKENEEWKAEIEAREVEDELNYL